MTALKRLNNEYKHILKEPNHLFTVEPTENFLLWNFIIFGPPETIYENGIFKGTITFPPNYPIKPPQVMFDNNCIYHPNIYPTGKVCISILHEGEDIYGYESVAERWSPAQNVSSIMLSIISMLSAPNFESPANIEASVLWKNNPEEYKRKIYSLIAKTLE
jgi:ubiquitin-protein ligase